MKLSFEISALFVSFLFSYQSVAQQPSELKKPSATLMNINKISAWIHADGRIGFNPHTKDWGVSYPRGTASVVWQDNMVWCGFVKDGRQPELQAGGGLWYTGTVPGAILNNGIAEDTLASDVRIWRIRRDWQTADLTNDAAEFFHVSYDSVTQAQINAIRLQYEKDWHEWPWQKGAPFYDINNNGIKDDGEEPGLAFADQVVWFVANDLDSSKTRFGSLPIGLEEQVTLWGYNRSGSQLNEALQHVIFKQVKLIYKGTSNTPDEAEIDSMFIAQFVDTEIGSCCDDFGGCDTSLQMGYGYNSTTIDYSFQKYNLPSPAFGYSLIQGPLTKTDNPRDKGLFDFTVRNGYTNLKMTSFWLHATGGSNSPPNGHYYNNTLQLYHLLNGFYPYTYPNLDPVKDPFGNATKYVLPGDPVKGTGWIDGMFDKTDYAYGSPSPGERYFTINSGPFSMASGDTQEVVIAMVGGLGADRLASVSVMKYYTQFARQMMDYNFDLGFAHERENEYSESIPLDYHLYQNFPNPFGLSTNIRYDLPVQRHVHLAIYNILGQNIKTLVNNVQNPGSYSYDWDGKTLDGMPVPNGIYICKLEMGTVVLIKKMLIAR